jgi:cell wall-associated NlpC family hydrolase
MRNILFISVLSFISCTQQEAPSHDNKVVVDSVSTSDSIVETRQIKKLLYDGSNRIATGNTTPEALLSFAKSLEGTPYVYASADPESGFDCSGFITYVFNHFNIAVPRSSIDFTNIEPEVPLNEARPGDLILFTGTDSTNRNVGHMGIIAGIDSGLTFIHATSGKAMAVTITPLNDYYRGRFVKVIRVFGNNQE